jgi:hypothetical protein
MKRTPPLPVALLCAFPGLFFAAPSAGAEGAPGTQAAPRGELTAEEQALELRVWELVDLAADGVPRAEILEKLGRIAERDPRAVFEIYAGVAVRDENGAAVDWAERERLLRDALNSIEPADLLRYLRASLADCALATRLAAIELLVESPDPRGIDLVWELLAAADPVQLASPRVTSVVGTSLCAAFQRHPHALRAVTKDPAPLGPGIWPLVALAAPQGTGGSELLLALLGLAPEVDRVVLERLGLYAADPAGLGGGGIHRDVVERVRACLDHEDWAVRQQALVTLGYLIDPDSIPAQVAMLEDEHRGVQRSALWALERATGQHLGRDRAAWSAWFDGQSDWMRGAGQATGRRLLACSDAEAVAMIRELSQHALFRHAITDMLSPVLFRENPSVVRAVCATLAQLGSPRAIGHLIEGLEHARPECRAVIHASLVELTGRELPEQQAVWAAEFAFAAE